MKAEHIYQRDNVPKNRPEKVIMKLSCQKVKKWVRESDKLLSNINNVLFVGN